MLGSLLNNSRFAFRAIGFSLCIAMIVAFFVSSAPALPSNPTKTEDDAAIATIVKIEKDFAEMQLTKDEKQIAAVEAVISDYLYYVSPATGVATKKELLDAIRSKDYVLTSTTFQPFVVKVYGSTAIVHCINSSIATVQGKDFSGTFVSFDVFEKRDGRWIWVSVVSGKVGDQLADKIVCNGSICSPNQPGFSLKK
jgi:hypothetical protein